MSDELDWNFPRCSALAANRPFAMDIRGVPHHGRQTDVEPGSFARKEVKVTAELPGLEEKDVGVELANGVLAIKGAKRAETEDKDRLFSERYYGRFERSTYSSFSSRLAAACRSGMRRLPPS